MAQQRRPAHRVNSAVDNAAIARRKLQSRRIVNSRRRIFTIAASFPQTSSSHGSVASSSPPPSARAVLVPLHCNLRRLPSRLYTEEAMRDAVAVGAKRKRIVNGRENTQTNGRSRSASRVKRRKASQDTSDDGEGSAMEIDSHSRWDLDASDSSEEDDLDSSDNYLIHEAPPRHLVRLRKDELVRLYSAAGLTEDAELLTKHEIVDCIVAARDDLASLPPSSPPGAADSGSSDYSSDGGNVAGGEETDFSARYRTGLARRNTYNALSRPTIRSLPVDRCYSLPQMQQQPSRAPAARMVRTGSMQTAPRRRGLSRSGSGRSSPTTSTISVSMLSPPATRTRSRKMSNETVLSSSAGPSSTRSKGKAKQVEFSDRVEVKAIPAEQEQDSDLTDLAELEESMALGVPSPRRLRSKGDRPRAASLNGVEKLDSEIESSRRVTPMRKAKRNITSLKESDDENEARDELIESDAEDRRGDVEEPASPTPRANRIRRTPLRRRLRPRRAQLEEPPSDGDDEGSDGEKENAEESVVDEDEDVGEEVEVEDGDETVREESDTEELEDEDITLDPRILRNGKVIGDEDADGEDEEEGEEEEEVEAEEDEEVEVEEDEEVEEDDGEVEEDGSLMQDDASVDLEADDASEDDVEADEAMEDDVDLTVATARTLVRLRRDDLVRLCEHRDLEVSGTKPQLADALLQWRDQHMTDLSSSPSSVGTARPPSTARPRRRKTRSADDDEQPVLLRAEHFHMDEPRTPPLSERNKETEPELELDLESLGLDDREIPPEKIIKLEKIGSGGFKDVFIGKFKGRKVAIAEFRGQLNAMDIKELKLLGDFDHPNIVRFLGVSIPANTRETPVMIVSELCSNGDLFDYVRNVDPPTLYRVLCIMLDIAHGLEYLHARKPSIIHRDCKSSNILITSKGVAKITDFGLAKVKQSTRSMVRSLVGTVNWQAPELWHAHPKYNHKVDVFSCAMVYWEILQWHLQNKKFPWEGMNEHAIYDLVGAKHQRPSLHGLRSRWCPEIVDLIERMWAQDHQDRPTMTEVVHELEILVRKYR
ncbi:hypothetical protein BC835DRAFT_1369050 [Cytidiella melzeri]|nr:hypothetical protein BC835DRAFT_1369050 [Cytidiella melzeri]